MTILWQILLQFIFSITFGVALAMTITPSRLVTSGFYRVHLWVLMGANVFATLILFSLQANPSESPVRYRCLDCRQAFEVTGTADAALRCPQCESSKLVHLSSASATGWLRFLAAGLVLVSYLGSVIWLYERAQIGQFFLWALTAGGLLAGCYARPWPMDMSAFDRILQAADLLTSGLLLGSVLTAMLLGHWYLNTPSMQLAPLRRLLRLLLVAVVLRMLVAGSSLLLELAEVEPWGLRTWALISFRWLAGLIGTLIFSLMTWQTLKVPNTQSATGILYAAVILTFLGELVSQLLGVDMHYPL